MHRYTFALISVATKKVTSRVAAAYDARGGGGVATTKDLGNGKLHVTFDPHTLFIPDVNYKTAKFLGAPMAPPFKIRIEPVQLEVCTCPATDSLFAVVTGCQIAACFDAVSYHANLCIYAGLH